MNNSYNVDQNVKEILLCKIAILSESALNTIRSDDVPSNLQRNPTRLKGDLLKALRKDGPVPGWMFRFFTQFPFFEEEADKLSIYENCPFQQVNQDSHRLFDVVNPFLLMIDGNNLIHEKLDSPFSDRCFPKGSDWQQTAAILNDKTDQFLQQYPESTGRIYRDSRQHTQLPYSKQLCIINSGGGDAAGLADQAILDDLEFYRRYPTSQNRIVISGDRDLNKRAVELGAVLFRRADYFELLQRMVA